MKFPVACIVMCVVGANPILAYAMLAPKNTIPETDCASCDYSQCVMTLYDSYRFFPTSNSGFIDESSEDALSGFILAKDACTLKYVERATDTIEEPIARLEKNQSDDDKKVYRQYYHREIDYPTLQALLFMRQGQTKLEIAAIIGQNSHEPTNNGLKQGLVAGENTKPAIRDVIGKAIAFVVVISLICHIMRRNRDALFRKRSIFKKSAK